MSAVENKSQIMTAFNKLIIEVRKTESKVETKEQEAEKIKNWELVAKTADYTVDNIVNGMAVLQLDFSNVIEQLTEKLVNESEKLEELKKAIAVEKEHLERLQKIRLVADTLYILRQEHQEKLTISQTEHDRAQEELDKEIEKVRKNWTKLQEEYALKITEVRELLIAQREKEAADYTYSITRSRQLEMDSYEETRRGQERELTELDRDKEKAWGEREKYLSDQAKEFAEHQKKIEGFEAKIKEDYNKAKGEAIKEAEKEAKVKTDLFEKEWEATKQGYELKIQSLEANIQRQTEQITELTSQLQTITTQAQNLAMRAFANTAS
jgi:hypothetical protein